MYESLHFHETFQATRAQILIQIIVLLIKSSQS